MSPLRSAAALTFLFSLVNAQGYDYYYYPTWPIYTAVILVFSIIVSIIGACCRRRAILQRQQRLQATIVTSQAAGPYPPGTYPVAGHYPSGMYPSPPTAAPYAGGFVPAGPAVNLPPYPGTASVVAPAEGYSNMGYAQGHGPEEDLYKPPPYSPPVNGYCDQSKSSTAEGCSNGYAVANRGDVPPPTYVQAADYSASTSTAVSSYTGVPAQQPQQQQQQQQPQQQHQQPQMQHQQQ